MKQEKKKLNTDGKDINGSVPGAKTEPEKVTNTVGTFLKEDGHSDDFQVSVTKTEPKKVSNMVGTF